MHARRGPRGQAELKEIFRTITWRSLSVGLVLFKYSVCAAEQRPCLDTGATLQQQRNFVSTAAQQSMYRPDNIAIRPTPCSRVACSYPADTHATMRRALAHFLRWLMAPW